MKPPTNHAAAWQKASDYAATLRSLGLTGDWGITVRRMRLRRGFTFAIVAERA